VRIALGIEYDGRPFRGWQLQRHAPSVQAALEQALSAVAAHPVRVHCAGRTDAGVHASGQVVHFDTAASRQPDAWTLGTNARLPAAVNVTWAREVGGEFDARRSARGRVYRYLILNRRTRSALLDGRASWHCRPLDAAAMQAAAGHLCGRHDFSAFRAAGCQARSPERTLRRLQVTRHGELIVLEAEADAFLMHMVRNIAGVLLRIGRGEAPPAWAAAVLAGRNRRAGGVTAPPDGLYLTGVLYPARFGLPEPAAPQLVLLAGARRAPAAGPA